MSVKPSTYYLSCRKSDGVQLRGVMVSSLSFMPHDLLSEINAVFTQRSGSLESAVMALLLMMATEDIP